MRVQPGRYQTKNSRIVAIHDFSYITRRDSEQREYQARVWRGTMYKADGRTEDSTYQWEDDGRFSNSQGITTYNDLAMLIEATGPFPEDAERQRVENLDLENVRAQLAQSRQECADLRRQRDGARQRIAQLNDELRIARQPRPGSVHTPERLGGPQQ